jgi:hypothetical protein
MWLIASSDDMQLHCTDCFVFDLGFDGKQGCATDRADIPVGVINLPLLRRAPLSAVHGIPVGHFG